jgi:hypothetical protein
MLSGGNDGMTIKWTEELVADICDHLATGKSLIQIGALQGYPSADSMYRQMHRDPEFAAAIAHARVAGQDHEADACVAMADAATGEDWQVVKLRIWARQWRASKLAPKKYGDKVALTGGDEGDKPLTVVIQKPE